MLARHKTVETATKAPPFPQIPQPAALCQPQRAPDGIGVSTRFAPAHQTPSVAHKRCLLGDLEIGTFIVGGRPQVESARERENLQRFSLFNWLDMGFDESK